MSTYTHWSGGVLREVTNGVLRREVPRFTGIARQWHANGVLAKEMNMVNGVADGIVLEWHDNGQLAREYVFRRGEVDGPVRQWSSEGKLLGEYAMNMGWGVSREWNEDGSLASELEKVSDSGYKGKTWDDLGKAHEVFLWNGKSVSKKRFFEKLERERAE